jgi:hypothetical protein
MSTTSSMKAGEASVIDHIATLEPGALRGDAEKLTAMLAKISGLEPKLWGPSIIGFGSYDYIYDSGRTGTSMRIGFAARKTGLVLYTGAALGELQRELARTGPHATGKGCVYLNALGKTDMSALEDLAAKALAIMNAKYPRG